MPVLPFRHGPKLYFSLCRTCTENASKEICTHSEKERLFTGVWVSTELQEALKRGYIIVDIVEVWHWEEQSKYLFRSYVDTFLKVKMEASGWPSDCIDEDDKRAYIRKIKETEGKYTFVHVCFYL